MRSFALGVVLLTIPLFGCATLKRHSTDGPKTLFQWNSPEFQAPAKEQNPKEPEKPNPIVTDRPDFTEASSTVGLAHIQLETGYTYSRSRDDGVLRIGHTYPEALVRVGLVRDWMELRFGQNFGSDHQSATGRGAFVHGADDVYLGVKLGLTEQDGAKPETAIVLQTTVPTGTEERSARRALPGMNFLYGWDVIEDKITLGGSFQILSSVDGNDRGYLTLAKSLTVGYSLTERVGAYTEWFAFFPTGTTAPGIMQEHYINGGFTFKPVPSVQFDVRCGIGLNRRAEDFFIGSGVSVRY